MFIFYYFIIYKLNEKFLKKNHTFLILSKKMIKKIKTVNENCKKNRKNIRFMIRKSEK